MEAPQSLKITRYSSMILLSCVIAACSPSQNANDLSDDSLFVIVNNAKTCESGDRGNECNYRIGDSFHVSIAGVGTASAGIHFMKSDANQPIYASFGIGHGCVIVNRFKEKTIPEFVFISPKNGVVYDSWNDCSAGL
jgi:hypothetical protein